MIYLIGLNDEKRICVVRKLKGSTSIQGLNYQAGEAMKDIIRSGHTDYFVVDTATEPLLDELYDEASAEPICRIV